MAQADRDVLSSLPRTRPTRRSAKRTPMEAAEGAPSAGPAAAAGPSPVAGVDGPSPAEPTPAAGWESSSPPRGLVHTAGELALWGLRAYARIVRGALHRLPKP